MTGGEVEREALIKIASHAHGRLEGLLANTNTQSCRDKVTKAFQEYMIAVLQEQPLPLERHRFESQCKAGAHSQGGGASKVGARGSPETVRFLYLILAHAQPQQVLRLIDALDEPGQPHSFVVHVDAKADAAVQTALAAAAAARANVHVLRGAERVEVQWGGFSVCQAMLNALRYAVSHSLAFDWFWNLSGTSYPLASNRALRAALAAHAPHAVFADVAPAPPRFSPLGWNRYVECDGRLHRIGRNFLPQGSVALRTGSQWFVGTPAYARWLLEDAALVAPFAAYAAHVAVADEIFFPTLLLASPFCGGVVHDNLHHVEFGRRSDGGDARAAERCLMPDPRHCGRSPIAITRDYLPVLEHSGKLFARKFDAAADGGGGNAVLDD
ncbi:core-2/I-branching enzyme-domain-containing protein, partial [Tribonema minus]